ncbi:MAG: hypothetical protein ACRDPG_05400 [Nocardioidaceae bacterium]
MMAVEFLLIISMLIVVFLIMLQYAVKVHAERVAAAAAQAGLVAAASYNGTTGDGERAANHLLTHIGPGLDNDHVIATRTAATASVTVTGNIAQLIPFLPVSISVRVEGPVERFVGTQTGAGQ